MNIRDKVIEHATACRAARVRGEGRPAWTGGLLSNVDLSDADLRGADLRGVDSNGANLRRADLRRADLRRARLCDAVLCDAVLADADLSGATLPDGRTLAEWQADPLAGLCDDPESVARAIEAWGGRTWRDCPLHAALGANSFDDVPEGRRMLATTFVALLDGGHLPRPGTRPATSAQQR